MISVAVYLAGMLKDRDGYWFYSGRGWIMFGIGGELSGQAKV